MKQRSLIPGSWRFLGSVSAVAVLTPLAGVAQDALRGAVEGDKSFAARRVPLPEDADYHRAGPVAYSVSLNYDVEYRDNILSSDTNRKSDFIHQPEMRLDGRWQATSGSVLQLGGGFGYTKYTHYTENDRLRIAPNSELGLDIPLKDFILTFYDRFSYSQDVASAGGLTGVASFPRFDNTVGTRLTWQPDHYFAQVGYGHQNFSANSALFNYLTRSAENFILRGGYQIAAKTLAGVESSLALVDYSQPSQSDNTSYSVGPFTDWQLTQFLHLTFRAGYVHYDFDPTLAVPARRRTSSYYAGAEARHDLTDFITHRVSVTREIAQAFNAGSQYVSSVVLNYDIEWRFAAQAAVFGDVRFEDATEKRSPVSENYTREGFGGGIRYQWTKRLGSTLRYSYLNRASDQVGRDYQINSVSLGLNYRF